MKRDADIVIIGAGIVGLATAHNASERYPGRKVVVLEKEDGIARHQTGNNSGVLHSGIYYKPGSLKAINCRVGKLALEEFCRREGIPFENCGKVIVATSEEERPLLRGILERGKANGVRCEVIGRERLLELEPHVKGIEAIHVPEAGIVDYKAVSRRLANIVVERGGEIRTRAGVRAIRPDGDGFVVETMAGEVRAGIVVNCAGLHSDRVGLLIGSRPDLRIIPFRGEYYDLVPEVHHLCRNLIYPVPDPNFPFLGVHFTRMIQGGVECGPNAVLAFAREGYTRTTVNLRDLAESLTYPGFIRLALRYWRAGAGEMWRSFSKAAFVRALQKLVPEIRAEHLVPAPAGIRAQAISRDGQLVDDFAIEEHGRVINVYNAPSPAATASLNIGRLITDRLAKHLT
jgi:(S)-2-hydroxyglutarate dehydrogenase